MFLIEYYTPTMSRSAPNKYNPNEHDNFLKCPRSNCSGRNAPEESDDFKPNCWKCNENLGIRPVEIGDEVEIEIFDIHSGGAGLGRTDDGFIVLVDGVLPEKTVRARITRVNRTTADAELVEVISEEIEDHSSSDEYEDEDDERLGSRDNYWGRD